MKGEKKRSKNPFLEKKGSVFITGQKGVLNCLFTEEVKCRTQLVFYVTARDQEDFKNSR
jgi:hypothetical protein